MPEPSATEALSERATPRVPGHPCEGDRGCGATESLDVDGRVPTGPREGVLDLLGKIKGRSGYARLGRLPARAPEDDGLYACVSRPEQIAEGSSFFRQGALCAGCLKLSVGCVGLLLVSGFACLALSMLGAPGPATLWSPRGAGSPSSTELASAGGAVGAASGSRCGPSPLVLAQGTAAEVAAARDWCCEHELVGCPAFDCDADVATCPRVQRSWCCNHRGRGCGFLG